MKVTRCAPKQHDYAFSTTMFNRDENGVAFWGFGKNNSAQFQTWVCRKCGGTIEVQVRPALVQREVPAHLRGTPNRFDRSAACDTAKAATA
jgi:hypothetical protein